MNYILKYLIFDLKKKSCHLDVDESTTIFKKITKI
jgi:hypothetical protein